MWRPFLECWFEPFNTNQALTNPPLISMSLHVLLLWFSPTEPNCFVVLMIPLLVYLVVQYIHLVSNFVLSYYDWCWAWFMICYFIRILNQMKVSLYILRKYCNMLSHLFVYFVFLSVPFSWALVCWMRIWGVEASWGAEIVVAMENCRLVAVMVLSCRILDLFSL